MDTYDGATCACGSAWFQLVGDGGTEGTAGLVALDERGVIIGYAGQLVCAECARPWQSGRERLRAV